MSDSHTRTRTHTRGRRALGPTPVTIGDGFALLARHSLRAGQTIGQEQSDADVAFVVEDGCVMLAAPLIAGEANGLLLLYPGDAIGTGALLPLRNVVLTAVVPSVLARARIEADSRAIQRSMGRPFARSLLHSLAIGHLTAEQRVLAVLVEFALHLGHSASGAHIFEVPLSRTQMATYLGVNPDTLSRLMTGLKARGVITMVTRRRAVVRDLDALFRLCPIAAALRRARGEFDLSPCGPAQAPIATGSGALRRSRD